MDAKASLLVDSQNSINNIRLIYSQTLHFAQTMPHQWLHRRCFSVSTFFVLYLKINFCKDPLTVHTNQSISVRPNNEVLSIHLPLSQLDENSNSEFWRLRLLSFSIRLCFPAKASVVRFSLTEIFEFIIFDIIYCIVNRCFSN